MSPFLFAPPIGESRTGTTSRTTEPTPRRPTVGARRCPPPAWIRSPWLFPPPSARSPDAMEPTRDSSRAWKRSVSRKPPSGLHQDDRASGGGLEGGELVAAGLDHVAVLAQDHEHRDEGHDDQGEAEDAAEGDGLADPDPDQQTLSRDGSTRMCELPSHSGRCRRTQPLAVRSDTMTKRIDRLERSLLVTRSPPPRTDDRRAAGGGPPGLSRPHPTAGSPTRATGRRGWGRGASGSGARALPRLGGHRSRGGTIDPGRDRCPSSRPSWSAPPRRGAGGTEPAGGRDDRGRSVRRQPARGAADHRRRRHHRGDARGRQHPDAGAVDGAHDRRPVVDPRRHQAPRALPQRDPGLPARGAEGRDAGPGPRGDHRLPRR